MPRNRYFADLKKSYLFPEVNRRVAAYREKNPHADLISLGIGDTVEPIHPLVAKAMADKALSLATPEGYEGYGPSFGISTLREKIASTFYKSISPDEITISDGAKPDIGRLQLLFGNNLTVAMQDPAYPVYLDTSLIQGHRIHFFTHVDQIPPCDLIFFCSPNNPTGQAATHEELQKLVDIARRKRAIIIFDAAYSLYIQDPCLPKSIYEIPGSHEVAIEINSFSKIAGFSGLRLGWTVVPKALNEIHHDWMRLISTAFNGASLITQAGALSALHHFPAIQQAIQNTMENTQILKGALSHLPTLGGVHAPYLFVKTPLNSWDAFQLLLEEKQIISTPGSGFGPQGEGYVRFTAFANRDSIRKAAEKLKPWED
jgi:LL-diaminopimelate aminotransferase